MVVAGPAGVDWLKEVSESKKLLIVVAVPVLVSCGATADGPAGNQHNGQVQSSGKVGTPLAQVPAEVAAAARAAQPDMQIRSAEAETRDGRRYFDIAGVNPDGSEIELDMMEEGGRWRVVETQRDIGFLAAPEPVRAVALAHDPALKPTRVIESRQDDGIVIYELFAPEGGDPQGRKVEVKWDGRQAAVLTSEWAH